MRGLMRKRRITLTVAIATLSGAPLAAILKGPKIETIQYRLKLPFNLDLQNSPPKKGPWWVARLKFSISLEHVNPGGRS